MGFISRLTDKEIMTLLQLGDFFDCDSVYNLALLEVMARIRSLQTSATDPRALVHALCCRLCCEFVQVADFFGAHHLKLRDGSHAPDSSEIVDAIKSGPESTFILRAIASAAYTRFCLAPFFPPAPPKP